MLLKEVLNNFISRLLNCDKSKYISNKKLFSFFKKNKTSFKSYGSNFNKKFFQVYSIFFKLWRKKAAFETSAAIWDTSMSWFPSTSPWASIWKFSSILDAWIACSAVICPFHKANAITKDLKFLAKKSNPVKTQSSSENKDHWIIVTVSSGGSGSLSSVPVGNKGTLYCLESHKSNGSWISACLFLKSRTGSRILDNIKTFLRSKQYFLKKRSFYLHCTISP